MFLQNFSTDACLCVCILNLQNLPNICFVNAYLHNLFSLTFGVGRVLRIRPGPGEQHWIG